MYSCSAYEVVMLAVAVEDEGAKFYAQLAGLAQEEKLKKASLLLSEQEIWHKKAFQDIADAYRDKTEKVESAEDIGGQMKASIAKIRETSFDLGLAGKRPPDLKKILEIAIHTEMQSVRVYSEMDNLFDKRFHEILSKIRDEEKQHLETLLEIKKKAKL